MSEIKEVCGNCQHKHVYPHEVNDLIAGCVLWNRVMDRNDTCQFFKTDECLLPTLEDVQKILKETK